MTEAFNTIKTVKLNNNCPECYSKEGLQLTFRQRFVETIFHKTLTEDISTKMFCNVCNTDIFPSEWTEDIERVYDYQMKAFKPKKKSKKYKSLFWILLITVVIIIAGIVSVISFY